MKRSVRPGRAPAVHATLGAFALATLLGYAGPAFPADEPISAPSLAPVDGSLIPNLPDFPMIWQGPALPLELVPAEPFSPEDKGGSYTDMGRGQPSRLTDREKALLDLSRAAVEASRIAGTLEVQPPRVSGPPLSLAEAERLKHENMLRAQTGVPVAGTGAPADRLGAGAATPTPPSTVAPVGASPVPLTPLELEKLATAHGQTGLVILPEPNAPVQEAAGAPRPPETAAPAVKNTDPSVEGK